jgi:HD-GYP domain-containing protein (c-di-GMP phosphodiesterase class II)/DNA-binding CsgD family transcriptional regulator
MAVCGDICLTDRPVDLTEIRLAELLASLSLATDLGTAFPLEKALRNALLAVHLGEYFALGDDELSDAYYMAMLRFLGCSAFAHELAAVVGGDDLTFHSTYEPVDVARPSAIVGQTVRYLAHDAPPFTRVAAVARFLTGGAKLVTRMQVADCEAADSLASRLGLSSGVRQGLAHVWARWDGKGQPRIAGEAIALSARVSHVANQAEIYHRVGGRSAAVAMLRQRRAADLDPRLVDTLLAHADRLFASLEQGSVWDAALAIEPPPVQKISTSRLSMVITAFAEFSDLKSPFTLGHSASVATLAENTARCLRMDDNEIAACRHAGLVHDLGRVGVPNGIWDKVGPLTPVEWERVRLHPYYTERVLVQSTPLHDVAVLAGMHHERRDGSGYHRASLAAAQPLAARVLAAADAFQAMTEPRPYREAMQPAQAAVNLHAEANAGKLDPDVVNAVLTVAGQRVPKRTTAWPGGLSDREVEVLRLVARGISDKEIGRRLVISPVTVHHHVRHIYDKIGVSSRAGAALFAMQHDLVAQE